MKIKSFKFWLSIFLFILFLGCDKDNELPAVETIDVIELGHKTALAGGIVKTGENLGFRGLCWGINAEPTIENNRHTLETTTTNLSSLKGEFTALMTSLEPNTKYFFRAYVDNSSSQIAYGQTYSFTTLPSKGTVLDIEGNVYQTAQIGNQLWMAANLKTTHYSNGDEIKTTEFDTTSLNSNVNIGYQWTYSVYNDAKEEYGKLYNWYAITDSRNVCPDGWHVPSDDEWDIMFEYLGKDSIALKIKEQGEIHWISNELSNNLSDFTALPGGGRNDFGEFYGLREDACFWSSKSTPQDAYYGYWLLMSSNSVHRTWGRDANAAFSVRCIKD